MTEERRSFLALLDFEDLGTDCWGAPTPAEGPPRLFGGQVASQALMAACLTVDRPRRPHSLHGYFIRPGRPNTPLELVVERTRDGRSFTTRHVTALQREKAIFELTASFHADEEGSDWQEPFDMSGPGPGDVSPPPRTRSAFNAFWGSSPFEIRPIRPIGRDFILHPCWVRIRESLGDDPALHACALTFISDLAVTSSARAPLDRLDIPTGASLDHAVWFHRSFKADEWSLFSVEPISNFGSRGLARGSFHQPDGVLIASMNQEVLLRSTVRLPTGAPEQSDSGH
jgi:acyl-CoA thioesterase-2